MDRLCYPRGFQHQYETGLSAVFSPGVCPHGYTGALVEQHTEEERAITSYCCPVGMSYAQSIGCMSTVTTSTTVVNDKGTTVTMTSPFIAADWDIKVVWAYSQLDVFTPASAPLLRRVSLGSATPTNNVTSQGRPPRGAQMERAMSPGQLVGISAGVLFFVVAVFASGVYALWRRKRNRQWVGDTSGLIENQDQAVEEEKPTAGPSNNAQTQNNFSQAQQTNRNVDPNEYQRLSEDDSLSIRAALHGGWQPQDTGTGTSRG